MSKVAQIMGFILEGEENLVVIGENSGYQPGFFFTANFPQEKYFSPSNQFSPQEINFPYVDTKYCYAI